MGIGLITGKKPQYKGQEHTAELSDVSRLASRCHQIYEWYQTRIRSRTSEKYIVSRHVEDAFISYAHLNSCL